MCVFKMSEERGALQSEYIYIFNLRWLRIYQQ